MSAPITVILPVYNGMPYLPEAIESVLAQQSDQVELLIVDDCSCDESRAFLAKFATDPRISIYLNERNLGLYATLNKAITNCDSKWIVILMQDDRLKDGHLFELLTIAGRYSDVRAVWAEIDLIGADGRVIKPGLHTCKSEYISPGSSPWKSCLHRGCIWTISGSFTRRELYREFPFREDLPHCGDYDWLLRAIRSYPFVYYEKPLSEIRMHEMQASASNLHAGIDIRESYSIIRSNLAEFGRELSCSDILCLCFRRSRQVARRALAAWSRGRFRYGCSLARHAARYALLSAHATRWR